MSKKKSKTGISPQIWVAIITTVGVIIGALFAFPPFQRLFDSTPIPTPTNTPSPTAVFTFQSDTPTLSPTYTETFTPTASLTPTQTFTPVPPTSTFTLAPSLPIGMQVKVAANPPSGKAPLTVKLDARDSFVRAPDGKIFECRKGGCKYVWYAYLNGEEFIEPQETNGTLELKLEKRGNYFVSVYICHGADSPTCASGGTVISVE